MQAVYTRPLKEKLDKLNITHEIVWEPGPGEDTRERVEAVKRWFVHDWQTLDNKIRSSIVEGVSVFLAMFDMPDVAKVFCPVAPHITDDPQAIILQAAIKRAKAEKDAKEPKQPEAQQAGADEAAAGARGRAEAASRRQRRSVYTWGGVRPKKRRPEAGGSEPQGSRTSTQAGEGGGEASEPVGGRRSRNRSKRGRRGW